MNLLNKLSANIKLVEDKSDSVEEALKKALANTTPERPGTPWDKKDGRKISNNTEREGLC